MQDDRLPPHDINAEESVLGSMLSDPGVIARIRRVLESRDFYRERNGLIYQAMLDLDDRDEPIDERRLISELDRTQRLDQAGGQEYLERLKLSAAGRGVVEWGARLVANRAMARRLISAGGKIAHLGFLNDRPIEDLIAKCHRVLHDAVEKADRT